MLRPGISRKVANTPPIQNIYTKIGVSNRAAATRWAMAHRVVDGAPDG